jgi:tetratricopeptide (TPR) repeat protein
VFERDYLIRLLTQAGLVLGKAMGLREQGKQKEALDLIDEFLGRELRLRSRLAMGLSDDDLLAMLSVTGAPNAESVAVVAAFIQEEGKLFEDLEQPEESVPRFEKALRLNLYLLRQGEEIEGWDIGARADELIQALSDYRLDAPTSLALWRWHEAEGRYADSENILYELQEIEGISAEEGDAFYGRLSLLDDAALDAGGFSREELEEGRRQWSVLTKETDK